MGALGGFSDDDIERERYDRDNRLNPAEYAPGQEVNGMDDDFGFDDPFANSDPFGGGGDPFGGGFDDPFGGGGDPFGGGGGFNDPFGGGGGFNDPFGGGGGGGFNPTGNFGNNQGQNKSQEDQIFEAVGALAKGTGSAIKDIAEGSKGVDRIFFSEYGASCVIAGIVASVAGLVMALAGKAGVDLLVGGMFSAASGVLLVSFNKESADTLRADSEYMSNRQLGTPEQPAEPAIADASSSTDSWGNDGFGNDGFGNDGFGNDGFGNDGWGNDGFDNNDGWGNDGFDDDGWGNSNETEGWDANNDTDGWETSNDSDGWETSSDWDTPAQEEEPVDIHASTNAVLDRMESGIYTRELVFNYLLSIMSNKTPDYASKKVLDEDSSEFLKFSKAVQDAGRQAFTNEKQYPELVKVEETLFQYILTCTRKAGVKDSAVKVFADEITKSYARDDNNVINQDVYSKFVTVGGDIVVSIFRDTKADNNGKPVVVTYKDAVNSDKVRDFILDTDNKIPVVFGVDELGNPIMKDLAKYESIIIQGAARRGKSWVASSIILQMCTFMSPRDLDLYIFDAKKEVSAYRFFTLPQVRGRYSEDNDMIEVLKYLVNVEAERRDKMIASGGANNIWDYNKKNPDATLKIIYIVIDEAATLALRMEKSGRKKEFQDLLFELVTKLPAFGIRVILIPHLVKDHVIKKSVTDMIKVRMSVGSPPPDIEDVTGAKPKDFPYNINNKVGEMAFCADSSPIYVKSVVLSESDENNFDIYNLMTKLWLKLEPDCKTEITESFVQEETINNLVEEVDNGSFDDVDISDSFTDVDNSDSFTDVTNDTSGVEEDFWGEEF